MEEGAVSFYEGSFKEMQNKARVSNKPYLIDFYTVWCGPCKNMEKFTFTNKELAQYMKDNYFAMKVDAESLMDDGADLAQKYDIRFFPTLIIVSPKGEVLKRLSGFQSAEALLAELKKYKNMPSSAIAKTETSPVTNTPATPPATPLPAYNAGEGLFKLTVARQESAGFGVQIGVYGDYANVIKEAQKLEENYHRNVLVNIVKGADKTIFKLLLGPFSTKEQAETYMRELKTKEGKTGVVVDLGKGSSASTAVATAPKATNTSNQLVAAEEGRGMSERVFTKPKSKAK